MDSEDFIQDLKESGLNRKLAAILAEEKTEKWESDRRTAGRAVRKERQKIKRRIRSQRKKWEMVQEEFQIARKSKMMSQRKARKLYRRKMKKAKDRHWLKFRELKYKFVFRSQIITRQPILWVSPGIYRTSVFPIISHFHKTIILFYLFLLPTMPCSVYYIVSESKTNFKKHPLGPAETTLQVYILSFAVFGLVLYTNAHHIMLSLLAIQRFILYFYPASEKILNWKQSTTSTVWDCIFLFCCFIPIGFWIICTLIIPASSLDSIGVIFYIAINIILFASAALYIPIFISIRKLGPLPSIIEFKPHKYVLYQTMAVVSSKFVRCSYDDSDAIPVSVGSQTQNTSTPKKGVRAYMLKKFALNSTVGNDVETELLKYRALLNSNRPDIDSSPLHFWSTHASSFPIMLKVARRLLAAPASSSASERLFSKCSDVARQSKRAGIKTETLNSILMTTALTKISKEPVEDSFHSDDEEQDESDLLEDTVNSSGLESGDESMNKSVDIFGEPEENEQDRDIKNKSNRFDEYSPEY
ncbi:hypothetical protein CRE_13810 [Caenorhabditis remanei]|uniref:HAT C-terminal dimerisation domain-containing protein n=1 Tax=Caenorhabditis remanei TaxID=31234 RepID=E3NNL8_CAERE|nr:hypothetical protein CRE_13810 [Caenorhabditis remanei]